MSLETELTAILTAAAIAPITDRAFLRITGPDATRWLNGMVTNNIKDLSPGEGNYNFLLNAQGRILADCTIYREPHDNDPTFLLEADSSQLTAVNQTLDKFIIMDDVELSPLDIYDHHLILLGPEAPKVLAEVENPLLTDDQTFAKLPPLRLGYYFKTSDQITTPPASIVPAFKVGTSSPAELELIRDGLIDAGATPVSLAALEAYRILSGTPRYGTDIRNADTARDLPQETAQTHALNFNKGCYLGQEIVERIHSRGQVHRTFARFELKPAGESQESLALPTVPCPLTLNDKPVGELTSAAFIPLASGPTLRALGYIRREAATATLTYPGGSATVLS